MRVAARFGFPELDRYIPPSYAAAAWALSPAVARDLCLTGRTIDASEALALGVVSRISGGREALDEIDDVGGQLVPAGLPVRRHLPRVADPGDRLHVRTENRSHRFVPSA